VDYSEEQTTQMKLLLFRILRSAPKLKKFQFDTYFGIRLSVAEFREFLHQISRLEVLSLSVGRRLQGYFVDDSFPVDSLPSTLYTKLTTLRLSFYNEQIYSGILNQCRCLQYLHLENVPIGDETLRNKLRDFVSMPVVPLKYF
jgi:hypothetical protein